jgi:23S rRNA-/tRNA-specific pseudouridylate synthase
MTVHPGAGIQSGTVVNALLHHVSNLSGIGGLLRPGVVTRFEVNQETSRWALVLCQIYTGRTHQIRLHLHSIGHPVLGDKVYGKSFRRIRPADVACVALGFFSSNRGELVGIRSRIARRFSAEWSRKKRKYTGKA